MIFGRLLKLPNDMRKWDHVDKNFYRTKWKSAQFTTAPAVFKWCEKYFFASNAHTHKKQNWVSVAETVFFFNGTRRIWKKMCVSSLRKHYLKYLYTTILWLHFFSIFLCLFTGFVCIINTKQMRKMAKYFFVNLLHNFKCDIEITEKKNTEKIYINFYWTQKYDMNCFFLCRLIRMLRNRSRTDTTVRDFQMAVCNNFFSACFSSAGSFAYSHDLAKCAIFLVSIVYFSTSIVLFSGFLKSCLDDL